MSVRARMRDPDRSRRRMRVPEVIQTSANDCGPACMTSFLAGFGIPADYARLREVCYTDVDGTSIDDMEDVAVRFGLDAHQTMVPPEHLLAGGAGLLPAIVVLALPGGIAHFVVIWRRLGAWFEVMDPMSGRRWMHRRHLLQVLYPHRTSISAEAWRAWAGTGACVEPLRRRLRAIGVPRGAAAALLDEAVADESWRSLATIDALTRLVEHVTEDRGRAAGREAARLVAGLAGRAALAEQSSWVPARFYSVHAAGARASAAGAAAGAAAGGATDEAMPDELTLSGAVLVTASERTQAAPDVPNDAAAPLPGRRRVFRQLFSYLRADGALAPSVLAVVAAFAGCAAVFEALLFKGVLEMAALVHAPDQRIAAVLAVACFAALALVIDLRLAVGVRALGRRIEARLRIDFLRKLARLPDGFFSRRLTSDMTLRIHSVVQLRGLPGVAESVVRAFFSLLCTTAGIIWIEPACAPHALVAMAAAVGLPLLLGSRLGELQLAVATHQGGLSRYILDALLGALPLRAHVGQQALRAEYGRTLGRWARARRDVVRASVLVEAAISATGLAMGGLVLHIHLGRTGHTSSVLLLLFWAMQLPALGRTFAHAVFEYPARRAAGARLLESLHIDDDARAGTAAPGPDRAATTGARVAFRGVGLAIGRARLLERVDLEMEPGCHCAVVGASGAGKTSLIGLLLGWHRATSGRIDIDGRDLDQVDRDELFAQIAWVDPQVQIWNRSLYDNLTYGAPSRGQDVAEAIEMAGLRPTLDKLPEGLGTILGDGGSALSQGEAQRVRIARALLRRDARLVLLDEPFCGLDRETRARSTRQIRRWWRHATMVCVTHDVAETLDFDRVVVIDGSRAVEQGRPTELARRPGSTYGRMLESERRMRAFLDEAPLWRRWTMRAGRLEVQRARDHRRADEAGDRASLDAEAAS